VKATISLSLRWVVALFALVVLAILSREALAAVGTTSIPGVDNITESVTEGSTALKSAFKVVVGVVGVFIFVKGALQAAVMIMDEGRGQGGNAVWVITKLAASVIMIGVAISALT
jgi:hypothetical protein